MESDKSFFDSHCVLPDGEKLALYEVFGGELNRLYELPFSALDKFVTSDKGWIAIFTKEDLPRVICWNVKSKESITLPLENRYTPLAITFSSEVLFIGGNTLAGDPFLGFFDLGDLALEWQLVQLPPEAIGPEKAIDALIVDGQRLIVIDNLISPKYLLLYDISEPLDPALISIEELPIHGTYEEVISVYAGRRWIAISSITVSGWSGAEQHIEILDKTSLHGMGGISEKIPDFPEYPSIWSDLAFMDDLLLVAGGQAGLGIIDLSEIDDSQLDPEFFQKDFSIISLPAFQGEKVVRTIPSQISDHLGLVLEQGEIKRSLILNRQDIGRF
jgi:hypothetical protein